MDQERPELKKWAKDTFDSLSACVEDKARIKEYSVVISSLAMASFCVFSSRHLSREFPARRNISLRALILRTAEDVRSVLKSICCLFQEPSGTISRLKLNDKKNAKVDTKSGLFVELYPGGDESSPCLVHTGLFQVRTH